jgi:flavin-dependent dehydrogenase
MVFDCVSLPKREVSVLRHVDVAVAGGGAAGVAAAVSAARAGARVVLLERNGFLGGHTRRDMRIVLAG